MIWEPPLDFHFDSALSGADVASGFVSIGIGESPYWQYIVRVKPFPVLRVKCLYTFDNGIRKSLSTLHKYICLIINMSWLNSKVYIKRWHKFKSCF